MRSALLACIIQTSWPALLIAACTLQYYYVSQEASLPGCLHNESNGIYRQCCTSLIVSAGYLFLLAVAANGKVIKDVNGKSANLNNCLQNVIYSTYKIAVASKTDSSNSMEAAVAAASSVSAVAAGTEVPKQQSAKAKSAVEWDLQAIPLHEMFVILDADQVNDCCGGGFQHEQQELARQAAVDN
jgi:hypothetical protein